MNLRRKKYKKIPKDIPSYMLKRLKKCIKISIENNEKIVTSKEGMKLFGYSENTHLDDTMVHRFLQYNSYDPPLYLYKIIASTYVEDHKPFFTHHSWYNKIIDREENKHRIIWYKLIEHGGWL